jgi:putative two-component system response regulator
MTRPTVVIVQEAGDPVIAERDLDAWPQVRLVLRPPGGAEVPDELVSLRPDVLVLGVDAEGGEGRELLKAIRSHEQLGDLRVLAIAGKLDRDLKIDLLTLGADDFMPRPADGVELRARVHALARRHGIRTAIGETRTELDQLLTALGERGEELERLTGRIVEALEQINLANDSDTGNHIRRVAAYGAMLADVTGCSASFVEQIRRWAGLHDVGKVGIRGAILRKPGRFTPEEYTEMKAHTTIGHELLVRAGLPQVACNIALSHHEWWDGSGYPMGIHSTKIPLEARITSVADVWDAIRNRRCYRDAKPYDEVRAIMMANAGTQFDPLLVEAFFANEARIQAIYEAWRERAPESPARS